MCGFCKGLSPKLSLNFEKSLDFQGMHKRNPGINRLKMASRLSCKGRAEPKEKWWQSNMHCFAIDLNVFNLSEFKDFIHSILYKQYGQRLVHGKIVCLVERFQDHDHTIWANVLNWKLNFKLNSKGFQLFIMFLVHEFDSWMKIEYAQKSSSSKWKRLRWTDDIEYQEYLINTTEDRQKAHSQCILESVWCQRTWEKKMLTASGEKVLGSTLLVVTQVLYYVIFALNLRETKTNLSSTHTELLLLQLMLSDISSFKHTDVPCSVEYGIHFFALIVCS